MDKKKGKILILVEGARTDLRLMKHLLRIYEIDSRHEIVSYNTNIYTLYSTMFKGVDNPADLDILQHLKEHEPDAGKKKLFDERFSDILLVFDLDPHAPDFSADKIIEMATFFVESSDMGKLYINYPMVESFYHMKSIPDPDYCSYQVSLNELRGGGYKARVNAETRNHDYSKFAIDKGECNIVIGQNLEKARRIMSVEADRIGMQTPDLISVLKKQLAMLRELDAVDILCTCAFYIPDYNPRLIH